MTAKAGIAQSEAGRVFHLALSTGQFCQLLAIFSGVVQPMLVGIDELAPANRFVASE
jgi:hypothetical protein